MAVENLAQISAALQAGGRAGSTPVAAVMDASLPTQQVVVSTLAEVGGLALRSPAVVVIGEVVAHRAG
jgi:siroheme synthase